MTAERSEGPTELRLEVRAGALPERGPLVVLAITHSPVQAGLVGALRGLPFALLCLPAGALVDRWDRKRVMLLSDRRSGPLHAGSIPLVLLQRENSAGESRKRSGK